MNNEQDALPPLCPEQEAAVEKILQTKKKVIILTGSAGVGKSVLVKTLIERHPTQFTVTSTTARSALHIGGVTVDRLFSINRNTWKYRNAQKMMSNLRSVGKYIIIDEASMVGTRMANLLEQAAKKTNKTLILCGDWAQASPVKDSWPTAHALLADPEIVFLKESHRQSDENFLLVLNDIRLGTVTPRAEAFFSTRIIDEESHDIEAVKMYATNSKVDSYNHSSLEKHSNDTGNPRFSMTGEIKDVRDEYLKNNYPLTPEATERLLGMSPIANNEPLAIGCRVMVTYNLSSRDNGIVVYKAVNGDTGTLLAMEGDENPILKVLLDRTKAEIEVRCISIDSYGTSTKEPDYVIRGLPIRLGYAVTVHKSQGMSLNKVEVDMESIMHHPEDSRHGLAYVAFSRARTPEGLSLLNWIPGAVYSDPKMAKLIQATAAIQEMV